MTLAERLEAQRRKQQPPEPASEWLRRAQQGRGTVRVDYGRVERAA